MRTNAQIALVRDTQSLSSSTSASMLLEYKNALTTESVLLVYQNGYVLIFK